MLVHSKWCKARLIPILKYSSGIVVPQINTAEEARAVVSHSKFPPQGLRGQGSAFPAITHGIDIPTYLKTANETLITCIQIETRAGVENVDAICAVPGVGECLNLWAMDMTSLSLCRYDFHRAK